MISLPNEDLDPVRFLAIDGQEPIPATHTFSPSRSMAVETQNECQLAIAFKDHENCQFRYMSVHVPNHSSPEDYPLETKTKLIDFMRFLFNVFTQGDENEDIQKMNLFSARDLEIAALQDQSFLFKAVVALASGHTREHFKLETKNIYKVRSYLSLWVATEMMRRALQRQPGILQELVADLLSTSRASDVLKDTLCKLRISASRERTRLSEICKVNERLLQGWNLKGKRHWIVFITYDNLGFRILGAKAGYDQYVFIQVHLINLEQLKKLGFYKSRESKEKPISRQRKTWSDLQDSLAPDSIVPTKKDYENLGVQILAYIEYFLPIIDQFPTLEESQEITDKTKHFECDMRLCVSHGTSRRVQCPEDRTASLEVEQYEDESAEQEAVNYDGILEEHEDGLEEQADESTEGFPDEVEHTEQPRSIVFILHQAINGWPAIQTHCIKRDLSFF